MLVDRHRFGADSDKIVNSDADPDQDPSPSLSHVEKSEYFLQILFNSNSYQCQYILFTFSPALYMS
jgi:hypothetical protein